MTIPTLKKIPVTEPILINIYRISHKTCLTKVIFYGDLFGVNPLPVKDENYGLVYVGGRTNRWMQATWNQQKFIVNGP